MSSIIDINDSLICLRPSLSRHRTSCPRHPSTPHRVDLTPPTLTQSVVTPVRKVERDERKRHEDAADAVHYLGLGQVGLLLSALLLRVVLVVSEEHGLERLAAAPVLALLGQVVHEDELEERAEHEEHARADPDVNRLRQGQRGTVIARRTAHYSSTTYCLARTLG